MTRHILIVDPDVAFATMLLQFLEEMPDTHATAVHTGEDALRAASGNDYDLAIVDMAVQDIPVSDLLQRLREVRPQMSLMVIPLEGDRVPDDLREIGVRGALPKPFFLPELPDRVAAALQETPAPRATATADRAREALQEMSRLAREVGAKAVFLAQGERVLLRVSQLPDPELDALASVIHDSWQTSARLARILGKEQLRFEQSIGGEEYLLYSLALVEDLTLSVVIEGKVPLGMIRHRAREAAEAIRQQMEGRR